MACLEAVAIGRIWVEDCILSAPKPDGHPNNMLTAREQEVLELVQLVPNKDVTLRLGIQPGTVKIHLKHVFEKTGVRGRHSLALAGLCNDGAPESRAMRHDSHSVAAA